MSLSVATVDFTPLDGPAGEAYDFIQFFVSAVIDGELSHHWKIMSEGNIIIEIPMTELTDYSVKWKSLKNKSLSDYQEVLDFIEEIETEQSGNRVTLHLAL